MKLTSKMSNIMNPSPIPLKKQIKGFLSCLLLIFLLNSCTSNAKTAFQPKQQIKPHATPPIDNSNNVLLTKTRETVGVFLQTISNAKHHLAAAAVARATSIFIMYPVDTIKTRIQMSGSSNLKFDGMYKGVGGSLFGQVPYGVLTFGSYEVYKQYLTQRFASHNPVILYAIAAILGDVTGSIWLCPSEVVKQQLQGGMFQSTGEAVQKIWSKSGVLGFYQGYTGALARDVPFRVAQLTSYEVTKNYFLKYQQRSNPEKKALSTVDATICGAIAGTFSAAITTPLDRMKTLLMTNGAAYGGSVFSCAGKIWREEGIQGFCTGVVPRVVYIAPSVMIFFVVYEQVQQKLAERE